MADITRVGVVGAGQMGNGIAQVFAVKGVDVVMLDISAEAAAKGLATITKSLDKFVSKEKMTGTERDAALKRISTGTDYALFKDTQLVIEAATENLELKRKIFQQIDAMRRELGLTFLIVEHRLEMLFDFVDSVYAMHMGQVIAYGAPDEVAQDAQVREVYFGE